MITTPKDYGEVKLCLKAIMDEKQIKRGTLARCIGTRFEVIDRWYNGNVDKLDMDVLARICCVLKCEVGDLLEYRHGESVTAALTPGAPAGSSVSI